MSEHFKWCGRRHLSYWTQATEQDALNAISETLPLWIPWDTEPPLNISCPEDETKPSTTESSDPSHNTENSSKSSSRSTNTSPSTSSPSPPPKTPKTPKNPQNLPKPHTPRQAPDPNPGLPIPAPKTSTLPATLRRTPLPVLTPAQDTDPEILEAVGIVEPACSRCDFRIRSVRRAGKYVLRARREALGIREFVSGGVEMEMGMVADIDVDVDVEEVVRRKAWLVRRAYLGGMARWERRRVADKAGALVLEGVVRSVW